MANALDGRDVEIQIRTTLQHLWAELSERSSDVLDPDIKYGGGPAAWREFLNAESIRIAGDEKVAIGLMEAELVLRASEFEQGAGPEMEIIKLRAMRAARHQQRIESLTSAIVWLEKQLSARGNK